MTKKRRGIDIDKVKRGWEKSKYCFCRLLGRVPAISMPKLGAPRCHTCGKPTR